MNFFTLKYFILGMLLGTIFFILYENKRPGNSFYDSCWIRKQPKFLAHTKVYFLASIIFYKGYQYNDIFLLIYSGSFFGLHLSQDISERYHIKNYKEK